MDAVVIAARTMALRLLPLLVAVLVAHAASGWVEHLPAHGVVEEDPASTVGLALCGATAAIVLALGRALGRGPRRRWVPTLRLSRGANRRAIRPTSRSGAPAAAAPPRQALQVFLN